MSSLILTAVIPHAPIFANAPVCIRLAGIIVAVAATNGGKQEISPEGFVLGYPVHLNFVRSSAFYDATNVWTSCARGT